MVHDRLGFVTKRSALKGRVFIPRYYNPEIADRLASLQPTHDLVSFGDLVRTRAIQVSTGDEIGKMAYGTGQIPFVRTSDISNWEIKADPKQGVSEAIYENYAVKQDVRAGDIFFVRDGTYLIGTCCLITEGDSKILYQSHILKFRVSPKSPISAPLLLAVLSSPIVRRQVRAKQFTADIIDTIGNRYEELVLPVPKKSSTRSRIEKEVQAGVHDRLELRERLRKIPLWVQGLIPNLSHDLPDYDANQIDGTGNPGFLIRRSQLRTNIFVPRYYDPGVEQQLRSLAETHDLTPISDLVKRGVLSFDTGVEVGKMAYGMGPVPFIRTSDISNWELKADPKQSVSEGLYDELKDQLDVRAGDIFIVRDGTYLVGTSCIVTENDSRLIYCGGIYKIRVKQPEVLDPYLLLALLNCPVVRRQMKAKQFTRDVIDTLGKRLFEVVLPIPKDAARCNEMGKITRETVDTRAELRNRARQLVLETEGIREVTEEDKELLETV